MENTNEYTKDNCACNHDHHDENCDCEETTIITLTLDNDTEVQCNVLGIFDCNEKEYIALLPEEGHDVYLYRYNELGEDEIELVNIEDDTEYEAVSKEFEALFSTDNPEHEEL